MPATKILWGQILTVFMIVLLTTWGATQFVAWSLGFQAQLGHPWFTVSDWPIYYPPAFFCWWYFFDAYALGLFMRGAFLAASGGFIAIAVAIGMSVWRAREAKNVATLRLGALGRETGDRRRRTARSRWHRARPV